VQPRSHFLSTTYADFDAARFPLFVGTMPCLRTQFGAANAGTSRRALAVMACAFLVSTALASTGHAEETAQRSVVVRADVSSRTSLKVSADVLHVDVPSQTTPGLAVIEFSAGARTQPAGEVLLIVEPLAMERQSARDALSPAAAAFDGETSGAVDLSTRGPKVARRWIGSGLRRGAIHFSVRAPQPGRYIVPLRIVLTAP